MSPSVNLKNFSPRKIIPPPGAIDWEKARRVERFVSNMVLSKGDTADTLFTPQEFQLHDIIYPIFGTVRDNGLRQYTRAYIEIAVKNGKTTLCSALALYGLMMDDEPGAEVYSAASDTKQAGLIFKEMVLMIRKNPVLEKRLKINESKQRIIYPEKSSFYQVLCADSFRNEGLDAHMIIFDELHTQRSRDLYDVLSDRVGARRQPLMIMITTAGHDTSSICYEVHEYADQLIRGLAPPNPAFYAVIYSADDDDDWESPEVWKKANPGLGTIKRFDRIQETYDEAKYIPALQNKFRRNHLSQWTASEVRLVDMAGWDLGRDPVKEKELEGKECWGGLDLGEKVDMAAFVLDFPEGDNHRWLPFFWYPEGAIKKRARKHQLMFTEWTRLGLIRATPGDVMDFNYILEDIVKLAAQYGIQEIGYDPWKALKLVTDLDSHGVRCVEMRQGHQTLGSPTSDMLRLIIGGKLRHDGNPVLRWMADNTVGRYDPTNNVIPDRKKSGDKIDGIVAGIMALGCALSGRKAEGSMYDESNWHAVG